MKKVLFLILFLGMSFSVRGEWISVVKVDSIQMPKFIEDEDSVKQGDNYWLYCYGIEGSYCDIRQLDSVWIPEEGFEIKSTLSEDSNGYWYMNVCPNPPLIPTSNRDGER